MFDLDVVINLIAPRHPSDVTAWYGFGGHVGQARVQRNVIKAQSDEINSLRQTVSPLPPHRTRLSARRQQDVECGAGEERAALLKDDYPHG